MEYGVLEGKKVFVESCRERWADRYVNSQRRVNSTLIGKYRISTMFMGINHGFPDLRPLWFETMVFYQGNGETLLGEYQDRCETWEQAEAMHEKACEWVRCHVPFGDKTLWGRVTKPLLFIRNLFVGN